MRMRIITSAAPFVVVDRVWCVTGSGKMENEKASWDKPPPYHYQRLNDYEDHPMPAYTPAPAAPQPAAQHTSFSNNTVRFPYTRVVALVNL